MFFLLSNDALLPAYKVTGNVVDFMGATDNAATFVYNFDPTITSSINQLNSPMGVFGCQYIADPSIACAFGNQQNGFSTEFPDWLSTINGQVDLRGFYVTCKQDAQQNWYY